MSEDATAVPRLVLSCFPGGGILDHAFQLECPEWCLVRGPDPLWGGDIRTFHPPPGVFWGVYGGDPCQSFSSLSNLVRAKGLEPSFGDLSKDFEKVIEQARPAWFLRENVPQAPHIAPDGYDVRTFVLDNATLDSGDGTGNEQMRRRRWWFGTLGRECPELRGFMDFALYELPDAGTVYAEPVNNSSDGRRRVSTVIGQSRGETNWNDEGYKRRKHAAVGTAGRHGHRVNDGTGDTVEGNYRARRKEPSVGGHDGTLQHLTNVPAPSRRKSSPVTGRNEGRVGGPAADYSPPRRTLDEMLRLQGLPEDWLKHQPWTMQAKRKIIGNGVAVPMGRQLARAIREAMA
jgi:DNA (cytosine-5)-methyltransferase 1